MDKQDKQSYLKQLRDRAEKKIAKGAGDDQDSTLHELKVHQVELEMQNQQLRETQLQLQKALADYKTLYHQSPVGYVTLDKNGEIREANASFCRMVDIPFDQLRRRFFAELVADDYQAVFRQRFAAFYKQPTGKTIEIALKTPASEPFYVALQAQHLAKEEASQEPLLAVNVIDITSQRNVENSLFLAETVIDVIPDAVFICQPDGQILKINTAFSAITGFSAQQVVGQSVTLLSPQNENRLELRRLISALSSTESWRGDLPIRQRVGPELLCDLHLRAIYAQGEDQQPLYCIGVMRDVSLQRMMEKKLQQSQKMDSLGTLVGGLAHNFNNLIAGMIGNLFLLERDRTIGQKAHTRLEAMKEICDQASDMLKNLLAFTRSEVQQTEVLDLQELISVVIRLHRPVILESIQVDIDSPRETLLIKGDKNQLMQLLLNLLVNAVDALKNAENPKIMLSLSKTEGRFDNAPVAVPAVCLRFSDNGCGIPESDLDKIFDPFFSTKDVGKGTGLGLSTVYGIVKGMNGSIEVESRLGEGTTFQIQIPSADKAELVTINQGLVPILNGGKERILLVEDNHELREALCEILGSLDYDVTGVESGHQAMKSFHERAGYFDLLVTDAIMPETSGVELIRSLRKQGYDLPALMITANVEMVFEEVEELDCQLLRKPFEINTLSHILREMLDAQR
jgi:PAS domain S-box-containing protein